MVERFGTENYLKESGAEQVSVDDFGTLWRKPQSGDEAIVMVEVLNSTPEPDGSFKNYFIRVPPNMETPRQAIAWTFGMKADEYEPAVQT